MTGQGTRGEGKREMVVSITGRSMGGVFFRSCWRVSSISRPVSKGSRIRGAAEIYSVGQSVIPIRTLPSPSTQVSCV
jgi:hypothetical protein